jgi:glutamate-ammonia-ligase adenylyltransferase
MGLGKLGGRELSYASDLDLIFILDREMVDDRMSMETAIRLAQRFISYLSIGLDAGPGYEIDSRLRPSGRSGPLVVTLESFIGYHKTSQLWERQALLKMRHCLGPPALGDQVKKMAEQAIFEQDLPEDAAKSIDHLKQRMTRERGRIKAGTINLKFSPGGLVEAEFLTQYLQLVHGRQSPKDLRSETTGTALRFLAENKIGPANLSQVVEAYEIVSRVACRLDLIFARHGDRAAFTPQEIAGADISIADSDPLTALTSAMDLIRSVYTEVFNSEQKNED